MLLSVLVTFGLPAAGAELEGIKLADRARTGGGPEMVLNGAGVRTRLFVKVYVGALYLEQKSADAEAALAARGAKRIEIHMLRGIGSDQLYRALHDGLKANHGEDQMSRMDPQVRQFEAMFDPGKTLERGDRVVIDFLGDKGTRVSVNGEARGTIPGVEFSRAMLRIWLGDRPADADLKKALLGG